VWAKSDNERVGTLGLGRDLSTAGGSTTFERVHCSSLLSAAKSCRASTSGVIAPPAAAAIHGPRLLPGLEALGLGTPSRPHKWV
jgi:hypothetical protein